MFASLRRDFFLHSFVERSEGGPFFMGEFIFMLLFEELGPLLQERINFRVSCGIKVMSKGDRFVWTDYI